MNPISYLETGVLVRDDNLRALAQLPPACIDLVYLDPPFFSNRHYEVVWGDDAERRSFEDRWEGGIENYLEWMEARLVHLHRALKPTGSLYLHCDTNAGHYLKVACDRIFGSRKRFQGEIIWKRTSSHSDAKRYGRVHDNILFYTKTAKYTWNPQPQKVGPEDFRGHDVLREPSGRAYRLADASAAKPPGRFEWRGKWPPKGRYWAYSPQEMERLESEGRLVYNRNGTPRLKRYLDELPGVQLQDVWTDILGLNSAAKEREGYPTQKPEALLERMIRASSNPGDVVLDPFCGCGTTMAVAERLRRQWIGIDISPKAVEIMKNRLNRLGAAPTVYGLPHTLDDLHQMSPLDFQQWVIGRVNGHERGRHSGDMGIDGYEFFERLPIQVKQSERVGRNVVDNFETAVERDGKHRGYIVAFSFTKGAREEAARVRRQGKVEIVLVKAEDVLRVGELIDEAARDGRPPDPSGVAPDLMGLFRDLQEDATATKPRKAPRKRGRREAQQRFPIR